MKNGAGLSVITHEPISAKLADQLRDLLDPISVIADQLRELILEGYFRPGEHINETVLADRLSVSRTRLREALQRLSQEGLFTSKRNYGVFMIELTEDDVVDIYCARKTLELTAVEAIMAQSAGRRREVRDQLVEIASLLPGAVAAGDWVSVSRLDLQFHTILVAGTGNSRLLRAYNTLATESLICMWNREQAYPTPGTLGDDHLAIAELIASGSLDEIHSAFRRHLSA
jgi:DNA-binding GntR family transcriptional regulator